MELKGFKELLLRKAVDSPTLRIAINAMEENLIADYIIESLEKMAEAQKGVGRAATSAVTAFGKTITEDDVNMLNDALSHHVSHYRSALKNGNREVADKHLNKIIPLMHFITQAGKHSDGRLSLDFTSIRPWEMNYTSNLTRQQARDLGLSKTPLKENADPNELHEETKGLDRRLSTSSREGNAFSVPDYRFLEMPAHPEHPKKTHEGGYPFEDIQVGSQLDTKAKKAYLNIDDVSPQEQYISHPFDSHPAFLQVEGKVKQRSLRGQEASLAEAMKQWEENTYPEREQRLIAALEKRPHGQKGTSQKSEHFFRDIPLLERPVHAKPEKTATEGGGVESKPMAPAPAAPANKSPMSEKDIGLIPQALRHLIPATAKPAAPAAPTTPATPANKPSMSEEDVGNVPPALRHLIPRKQ